MRSLLKMDDNQHDYSDKQLQALVAVNISGATLSLLGAIFIIANYCLFASLRKNFAFKLILMIGISDLILAVSNLMGAPDHGPLCYIQAILQQIGDISGILWVVSVSWTINKLTQLTRLPTKTELRSLLRKMHLIIWSITIIITLLPLITSSYGVAAGWCWIQGEDEADIVWRYVCFYIPLWCAIIYMIVIYIKVFKRLNSIDGIEEDEDENEEEYFVPNTTNNIDNAGISSSIIKEDENSDSAILEKKLKRKQNNTLQRMKFYPLILIICYFFATIRRIIDWATPEQTPYVLALLHTFFAAIPGFLNAIVYGFTKDVKQTDKEALQKHCGCCKDDNNHRIVDKDDDGDSDDDNL